jgi:hypothetical protein
MVDLLLDRIVFQRAIIWADADTPAHPFGTVRLSLIRENL